ncbi:uncharacterized protein BX664DRAFT_326077 [Halteromyces radiatus]|uniref:uncharacterized protein n=1 Tax=Halteromyces radiatus TaxID=101107 RepID=UPI002220EAC5|nr:uncharacterized protein BX664DRAFT_326077 [Halteromyces radiatus]KAI8097304.1 hypothetical protein BX664DRAFT_326077 [Halteromyces radiatus]
MTNKLLLVFIHGFRGSDTSFKDFPNWLKTSLHDTMNMDVETIVYPSYKTTGDLSLAVRNFSAWLIDQTKNKENLDIILLGHSMGGIVGAETILLFDGRRHDNPLGSASIIGLLAYDTPFYSVNQDSLSSAALSQVDKYSRYIPSSLLSSSNNSRSTSSSSPLSLTWDTTSSITTSQSSSSTKKWGLFAGAVGAVGVAAVGAYLTRDKIASTVSDAYDQLEFVSALMDRNGCHKRMNALLEVPDIFVRCFYIQVTNKF